MNLPKVELDQLSLYHFEGCPFCVMVRSVISRLGLKIEMRNIHQTKEFYEELLNEGGKKTVPCLRVNLPDGSVYWFYESRDIAAYLIKHYKD